MTNKKLLPCFEKASGFTCATSRFNLEKIKKTDEDNPEIGPVVYVWRSGRWIVRVGKSESNVLRRAKRHVSKNTWNVMKKIKDLKLSVFKLIVSGEEDFRENRYFLHSFEQYLEDNHKPLLPQHIRKGSPRWKEAMDQIKKLHLLK